MKKYVIPLMLLLVFVFTVNFAVNAVEFKDVPKEHWAYQSVKELVDKGYLSLYEDGTFKGNNKVTRYELAELVARILDNIQTGKTQATQQDVDTLRKLSLEFRDELVDLAKKQDLFSQQINEVQEKNLIQNEDIGRVNERVSKIENEVTQIIDNILEIKKLQEQIVQLSSKIESLEKELNQTNIRIDEQNNNFQDLKNKLSDSLFRDLQDQQSINLTKIHSLQGKINELEGIIISNEAEIKKLKKENENFKMYLGAVALLALIL